MAKVLIIEDEQDMAWVLSQYLSEHRHEVEIASTVKDGLEIVQTGIDVILLDLRLPDNPKGDLWMLDKFLAIDKSVEIIIITGYGRIDSAVEAIKKGAFDYLQKPIEDLDYLLVLLDRAIEKRRLQNTERIFRQHLNQEHSFKSIIGNSSRLQEVISQAQKVAPTSLNVLLIGDTGTGKDMFARAIHQASDRYNAEFVTVDCGAMPESLIESELFGYERGAFTGAIKQKPGKFEIASGGTLFLDEIGNLSESAQMKLLRALAFKEIQRLGGVKSTQVDVRLLAATNVNLREAVKQGAFREDLYHRIAEFVINIPPLRERGDDINILAKCFLLEANQRLNKQVIDFEPEVKKRFNEYPWHGNVRELKNAILQATLMADDIVSIERLPAEIRSFSLQSEDNPQNSELGIRNSELQKQFRKEVYEENCCEAPKSEIQIHKCSLKDIAAQAVHKVEKEAIIAVLSQTNGNKSEAAKILNTNYKTLLTKIKQYGLE
jgi:two-component system response regulator HydG